MNPSSELNWKRFPFVDQFDEDERFYASPRHDGTEFTRALLWLPFGPIENTQDEAMGRVLTYSLPLNNDLGPCFTFEYALTCFALASLRIRKHYYDRRYLPISPDQHIDIYVKDAFTAKMSAVLCEENGLIHPVDCERRNLNSLIRDEAGSIFCDYYDEASDHYKKWYGSWCYPDMRVYLNPGHGPKAISQAISNTSNLKWIP